MRNFKMNVIHKYNPPTERKFSARKKSSSGYYKYIWIIIGLAALLGMIIFWILLPILHMSSGVNPPLLKVTLTPTVGIAFLQPVTCPDEMVYVRGEVSQVILGNVEYKITPDVLKWVEKNCTGMKIMRK